MNTVNEKLLTELKNSPITTNVYGEIKTIIDEDLRTALFDLLSQHQQEATPIKLGGRFLTQVEFNRMYTHYSELCDKEDTNGWWENQFHMANAQLQDLQRWKKEALAVMPDYQAIGKALGVPLGQSVHDKILPAIKEMKGQREWISVEDQLPKMGTWNICFYQDFVMSLYYNSGGKFTLDGIVRDGVTHWMTLPPPPTNHQ